MLKPLVALVILGFGLNAFAQIACPTNTCSSFDTACQKEYNSKMAVCKSGSNIMAQNPTSTGITEPRPPDMMMCTPENATSCAAHNQIAQQAYETSLSDYKKVKAQELLAQQQMAASQQYTSAMEAARAAQSQNESGKSKYNLASTLCMVASVALIIPCSAPVGGTPYCIASAAFAMFSSMAGQQAASHAAVENKACIAANQISSTPTNCGAPPTPFVPSQWPQNTTQPLVDNFDPNGNCIGTPAQCAQIKDNLPPGTNMKDVMTGLSQFASGKGPFKVNADGSITMKNGKTFKPSDFESEKSMIAAGMSPAQAAAIMADLNKQKAASDLDAKAALAKENEGAGGEAGAGSAGAKTGEGAGGLANGDANGLGKDAGGGKRGLASAEGLSKDFNGELIGVAGDDIFKMMNRRYKVKSDQDSFINGLKP